MKMSLDTIIAHHDRNLNYNSFIVDVGGYNGEYAKRMFDMFKCSILIFEPHPVYCDVIKKRFKKEERIFVEECALSNIESPLLYLNEDGSTIYESWYKKNKKTVCVPIEVKSVKASKRLDGYKIDVLKLNCEGCEYDIIKDLYENDMINGIGEILVQFHKVPELLGYYSECQHILSLNHERILNDKWQLWRRKL